MNSERDESVDVYLRDFQGVYEQEQAKEEPDENATFNFAWALIRSDSKDNVRLGKELLHGLLKRGYDEEDCLYYLAVACHRLDNALEARRYLERVLRINPDSRPAKSLLSSVDNKINKDGWVGVGLAGLVVAVLAGAMSSINSH